MKNIVIMFVAVITSAVVSYPVLNDPKPNTDEYSTTIHQSEIKIKPIANGYPLFFNQMDDKAKEPSVMNSGSHLFSQVTNKATETTKSVFEKEPITNIKRLSPIRLKFYPKPQGNEEVPKRPKELTVSVPRFKTDRKGKWVYNPWGVTYADAWRLTMPDIRAYNYDFNAKNVYKTKFPYDEVCFGRSTVYNTPPVTAWLSKRLKNLSGNNLLENKPLHVDLRLEIYLQGKSEACHTNQYVEYRPYLECAILRDMRMEYLMPMYPMIQIGNIWLYNVVIASALG
ncbi:uncharacterized protein Dana_GF26466, isoform A [Drosophila ananassae]|uniref:Uncharacterized protein, isoform A n=1 Tax=Drosophila ananassae TaxID=7217 RepID=A0A0P8Y980_DROAN|nr:uncharacterized protein LOC26513875 isoform X7 [Drosophila ananassae]KPU75736.1 uncharacterized protein Dana_GF26466, isoform A [Drosophila ananassae]